MNTLRFPKWLTLSTILLFISLLSSYTSNAQTGSVQGTLIDSTTNELIFGAIVSSPENPTIGTQSDMDGVFLISNLKPGTYNFKVSYIGYTEHLYKDVVVIAGQTTNLGILNMQLDAEVPVIQIVAQSSTNTEEAVVEEIKQSDNVVSGISAQQIQKGQDRDAAQVVQRIPGVSIIENRFIMVRGLNDRYNSVWLNNATAPSSETDRKAFSFDMVSSNLIDRVLVFKTASADLPGDFAGGFVKIYTITPKEKAFTFNVGAGYRVGTTGKSFYRDRSSTDWLGFDNGQRALPANLPLYTNVNGVDQATIDNYGKSFNNNWVSRVSNALPDFRFNTTYVNSLALKGASRIGMLASLNYTNANTNFNIKRIDTDGSGAKTQLRDDNQYTNEVRVGAMLNFSYIINTNNKIEFRNFLNQNGRTQTTNRDVFDAGNQLIRKQIAMAYRSRTIYTSQLAGEHSLLNKKTKFDWTVGYGRSVKNEPDLRRATYYQDPSNPGQYLITPANNANDLTNGGRLYQNLTENSGMAALNATHKFSDRFEMDGGFYGEYKARTFVARAFAYTLQGASRAGSYWNDTLQHLPIDQVYGQNTINNGTGWTILEEDNPTYKYNASNRMAAVYLSGKYSIGKVKVIGGLRFENNNQYIESSIDGPILKTDVTTNFLLPSINLSYNFTDKHLMRFAYGRTLNRPEFREFAPFYFYDFDFNAVNYGSLYFGKTLQVCTIDNYDLRYEYYPTSGEMISIAGFYKKFHNPIEQIALATSGGAGAALAYSFTNAMSAYNVGIELDIKKNLAFIHSRMENFSLLFNASLIKSQVEIPTDQADYWNAKRNLQGQSPYVVNAGLYYQSQSGGWNASVLYNIYGARIVIVGNSNYPDVVETPRSSLDLSITKEITKKLSVNVGAIDILNQKIIWVQDFNRDGKYDRNGTDNQLLSYKKGNYFTCTLRYKF